MRLRMMNLLRATGALATLVALVVGVPALLAVTVGNPFPAEIPSVDEIRVVLTQNGDGFGRFLLSVLAVLIWFLWAQVTTALIVETVAMFRRRPARELPTLPGIQPMVRRLIAALALSVTLAGTPVLAPALGALHLDGVEVDYPPRSAAPELSIVPGAAGSSGPTSESQDSVVLQDRTELWDLAEAAYGDGLAWTEIAAANAGLVDADGVALSATSESVAAGTSIRLPGSPAASTVASFGTHVVASGESLWSIAAAETNRRLGPSNDEAVATYWREVVAANNDTPSGDVDLIFPGDEIVLPGAGSDAALGSEAVDVIEEEPPELTGETAHHLTEVPALKGVIDGPVVDGSLRLEAEGQEPEPRSFEIRRRGITAAAAPELPRVGADLVAPGADALDQSDASIPSGPPIGTGILATAGGALLAAGIVGALRRRRALQWRQREPGRVPQRPSTEAAAFEAILAEAANQVETSQLGNGWVAVSGDAVERVLGAAAIGEIDLRETAPVAEPMESATVTAVLGTEEVTASPLFIGLAPGSVTALDGSAEEIARVANLLLLDLAISQRVDDVRVIAVGVGDGIGDLERVECVSSWPDACVVAHRLGAVTQTEGPIVAIGVTPGDADSLALLNSLGAAAVGPIEQATDRIRIEGDRAVIEPAGIDVLLATLADKDFGLVAELVEATALGAADEAIASNDSDGELPEPVGCPLAPGPIEVRVLGPVDVVGASPFSSVKAVDVVTYLAFHRQGVDADQLKTWVWPTFEPPTDKAFANVMSRARTGLGADEDGVPYLSRAGSDRLYRLDGAVTTDFDRLRGLVDLADDTSEPRQQLLVLQQALELVRGIPFSGGTTTSFAWADNHVRSHVEFSIDETVHRCADLALELGDHAAARAAIRIGLQVVPGCEQCFRRRFLIARADNNRQELRSAMADLERTAAAELGEPEGVDFISSELLMLFEELDRDLIAGSS